MDERFVLETHILLEEIEQMQDEVLCRLVCSGCREAEEVLAERYARTVRRLARPYFLAGGDSEDLIQEGMLGLISAIRTYDGDRSGFQTYLTVCVKRRIYTAIRDAQGSKNSMLNMALSFEQLSGDQGEGAELLLADAGTDPERFVIGREEALHLTGTIEKLLSAFERKVLALYLNGLSYAEMSAHLNRSVKSIDNAVQRVRKKLAHLLD